MKLTIKLKRNTLRSGKKHGKVFLRTSTFTPKIDILNQKIEIGVVEKMDGMITNHYKEIIDLKRKDDTGRFNCAWLDSSRSI
jgi:hypothetical protein